MVTDQPILNVITFTKVEQNFQVLSSAKKSKLNKSSRAICDLFQMGR